MPSLHRLIPLAVFSFTLALSSGLKKRQDLTGLPDCPSDCLFMALGASGRDCSQTDFKCLCKSIPFHKTSQACWTTTCSSKDVITAVKWATDACASIGVTIPSQTSGSATTDTATASNNFIPSLNAVSSISATSPPSISKKLPGSPLTTVSFFLLLFFALTVLIRSYLS